MASESAHKLNQADLVAFGDAAAGHDGVLSDPTGAMVIKPCTAKEIAFYQECAAHHSDFAALMPTFMGTLSLSTPEQKKALENPDPMSVNAALQAESDETTKVEKEKKAAEAGTAATLSIDDPGPAHGKKLETEKAIVLENVTAGFVKPNVLDVKLGARLWDDAAPPAKRARLDKVSDESTSRTLGFRIAGMRVWQPTPGSFKVYDKMYGRELNDDSIMDGFAAYFGMKADDPYSLTPEREAVVRLCLEEVERMQTVLENSESRMYSASILFVYEGDEAALKKAIAEFEKAQEEEEEAEGDDDDPALPKVYAAKLIDFAHAEFVAGQGPDENALQGVRSVRKILDDLVPDS